MKKNEFVQKMAEKVDMTHNEIREFLKAQDEVVLEAIAKEDSVPFGFGKIYGTTVAARKGRNPKTGEEIQIPEKQGQPRYKASSKAKE